MRVPWSCKIMIFSLALSLTTGAALGGDYQILGSVTPDYGYGDTTFNYTAQIQLMSQNTATYTGSWQMELKIYNGSQELQDKKLPSEPRILKTEEWMHQITQPFIFGPYNFEKDFGIKKADDASYEFIAYRDGVNVSSMKFRGPEVQPPRLLGAPSYNKQPYYVEPFTVAAAFKDKAGMNPTCNLEFHGPLNSSEKEESWSTADVSGKAEGTTYTFTLGEDADLSRFSNGGNFTFFIVYNTAFSTDREGPYPLTVRRYTPSIESVEVKDEIDYNNFTIGAYVDDVGKRLQGDGSVANSNATISIVNPKKEPKITNITGVEPQVVRRGGRDLLFFEWTENEIPFSIKDVELSKSSPFKATINYRNNNWNYKATKDSRFFKVVRELPVVKVDYNRTLYVRSGEPATQVITGVVSYSKGHGDLRLRLVGKDRVINESSDGVDLGGNRYKYTWSLSFNNSSIGNTYPFTLTFVHPSLEGGIYEIPEKYNFTVSSITLNFKDIGVAPLNGRWDGTYTYSAKVNSSVGGIVKLRLYNPCTKEWLDWPESRRIYQGETKLTWVIKPFGQECSAMQSDPPMFSLRAILDRPYDSNTVMGPYIGVAMPVIANSTVNPSSGTSEETFNYSAAVSFSKPASIELQTYNPLINQYVSEGTRDYNNSGKAQTLSWKLKFPADFQGKTLSYKFRYQDNDLVIKNGPTIQLGGHPKIYNSTVLPKNGSVDTNFTYNVTIGFSKKATLDLQTFNPGHQQYESVGLKDYLSPGQNETLIWNVKFPSEYAGQYVKYKIVDVDTRTDLAFFNGPKISGNIPSAPGVPSVQPNSTQNNTSVSQPETTPANPAQIRSNNTSTNISDQDFLRLASKYRIGGGGGGISQDRFTDLLKNILPKIPPNLIPGGSNHASAEPPSFVDARVTPNSGNWTDKFVYDARIQSKNDSEATLSLDVFVPSTKSWKSLDDKEVRSYMYKDHVATIQWKFQEFTPDDAGNSSKFRVYYYDQSNARVPLSPELVGPKNITKQTLGLRCLVTPENGTCKDMYNYTVQIYNPSKGRMKVALEVLLPGSGEWYPVGEKLLYPSRYGHNNTAVISWNVRPFAVNDVNKSSAFRVSYEDDLQNSGMVVNEGPKLENHPPKILNAWVDPLNGTSRQSFTFHAVVQDTDGDDLLADLIVYDPKQREILAKMDQGVRGSDASNQNGTELIWPYKFAESYENKSFQYNLTVSDGVTEIATGNRSGPNMLALPTITVDVLPPESQNNDWWDEYSFKVRVDNPSTQNALFTPAILTSNGWVYLDSWNVSETSGPETHEWKFSGFTANDRNRPIIYEIKYTLPDQYGRFSWISQGGNEKQISDVMLSGMPVAINLLWIFVLGSATYFYGGRLPEILNKMRRSKG